ncbi:XdhC family protein [Williamsia sp.]|uniref:XdhC family protein n=1 Tax=Williamsia sp. TaxID=1872085 RepID=UPI002F94B9B3
MKEFGTDMSALLGSGRRFALARVVEVIGSAPLPVGATMVVGPDGQVLGGVSGGCVEAAVVVAAHESIADGRTRVGTFGVADDDAFAAGLTCGGTIQVLVESIDAQSRPWFEEFLSAVTAGISCALWSDLPMAGNADQVGEWLVGRGVGTAAGFVGSNVPGGPIHETPQAPIAGDIRELLRLGRSQIRRYCGFDGGDGTTTAAAFVQTFSKPPRLVIVGAVDLARALSRLGTNLGYETVVCDARPLFATRQRFPDAGRVVCQWPEKFIAAEDLDARSVICVLTHDHKFDVPALMAALETPTGYIGALGSRATHLDRTARLSAGGAKETDLQRIHSPLGLDIGGRTAEQTAVSIMAEVIACAHGRSGASLSTIGAPIH